MSRTLLSFEADLPASALAEIEREVRGAAWLIDLETGKIVASNGRGADILGHSSGAGPPILDAAMPALARLRALATSQAEAQGLPLVFWGRTGAVRVLADIVLTRTHTGTMERAHERILALVRERAETDQPAASSAAAALPHKEADVAPGMRADARAPQNASPSVEASLAHELRTPLSAIVAASEIMKDERFGPLGSERYIGYARDIHASAQHVLSVVERMLSEGASEGMEAFDFSEIDVGSVLQATLSQVRPLAERAGVLLESESAARLPRVVADATSLRQMLLNLLTNALKFTEPGGRVSAEIRYDGDGPLTIEIADTGAGMSRQEVKRILSAHPQSTRESQRARKPIARAGLGLGLPLVQALAAANGAELMIESVPGRGTSASIVFGKDRVVPV